MNLVPLVGPTPLPTFLKETSLPVPCRNLRQFRKPIRQLQVRAASGMVCSNSRCVGWRKVVKVPFEQLTRICSDIPWHTLLQHVITLECFSGRRRRGLPGPCGRRTARRQRRHDGNGREHRPSQRHLVDGFGLRQVSDCHIFSGLQRRARGGGYQTLFSFCGRWHFFGCHTHCFTPTQSFLRLWSSLWTAVRCRAAFLIRKPRSGFEGAASRGLY